MRIIANAPFIQRRAKIARYVSLAGLALLGGGFVTSLLQPKLLLWAYATLPIGIILANIGIYLTNRYGREPRPDQMLDQALKGLDDRYVIYHYMLPSSHVLVTPQGLHPLIVKFQPGTFVNEDERWQHRQSFLGRLMRLFGQESIGNPTREARAEAGTLARYLAEQAPGVDVPIEPIIVFTHPAAQLTLTSPAVPVIPAKKLKGYVRSFERRRTLPRLILAKLENVLPAA